jgi:hypothetical protein
VFFGFASVKYVKKNPNSKSEIGKVSLCDDATRCVEDQRTLYGVRMTM